MLFGLHPLTACFNFSGVIHCDDDEPYPVVVADGKEIDLGELVRSRIMCTGEAVEYEVAPPLFWRPLSVNPAVRTEPRQSVSGAVPPTP
jgi:hypothetical protein